MVKALRKFPVYAAAFLSMKAIGCADNIQPHISENYMESAPKHNHASAEKNVFPDYWSWHTEIITDEFDFYDSRRKAERNVMIDATYRIDIDAEHPGYDAFATESEFTNPRLIGLYKKIMNEYGGTITGERITEWIFRRQARDVWLAPCADNYTTRRKVKEHFPNLLEIRVMDPDQWNQVQARNFSALVPPEHITRADESYLRFIANTYKLVPDAKTATREDLEKAVGKHFYRYNKENKK